MTEHQLQKSLIECLKYMMRPGPLIIAIANGGKRHIGTARKLKAEGVIPGVADLGVLMPEGKMVWLELKIKGGSLSAAQKVFRDRCKSLDHPWALANSLDTALIWLDLNGVLKKGALDAFLSTGRIEPEKPRRKASGTKA